MLQTCSTTYYHLLFLNGFYSFYIKIFDRLLQNEVGVRWNGWDLKTEGVQQEHKRERDTASERWERRQEMKRAGVLFIHLPLHWSSLWKTERQKRNNKKGGGALSNHFSAHYISPSSCLCPRVPHSLTLPSLCDDLHSNRYCISEGKRKKKPTKKGLQTTRLNKSLIVGEGKITLGCEVLY